MKRNGYATMAAAAAALLLFAAPAHAGHHTWKTMTVSEKLHVVNHQIPRYRSTVQWWLHNRRSIASAAAAVRTRRCSAIGIRAPGSVCVAGAHLVHALKVKHNLEAQLVASSFPPHHALWMCISQSEGGVTSVNPNGHYGMLQMSYNWLGYIRGAASDYPQAVQEWAAEKAYADNHYSTGFLYGQWFDYDGAAARCLPLA